MGELTELERDVLDIAGRNYRYAGSREADIRAELRIAPTRFWQILNSLLDRPEALAYAPATVKRHTRLRAKARHERSIRSLA